MIKMYKAEVLGKLPVIQHCLSFRTKDLHPSLMERTCTDIYIRGGVIVAGYLFQVFLLLPRTMKREERSRGLAYVRYPSTESYVSRY